MEENNEKLLAIRKKLLVTAIFCGLGWLIFVSMPFLAILWATLNRDNELFVVLMFFSTVIGFTVTSAPMLYSFIKNGTLQSMFFWQEYEVVTNRNGIKFSDGGLHSRGVSAVIGIFLALFIVIIGFFVSICKLIFLMIKYVVFYRKAEEKPSFWESAFPIMIAVSVVICLPLLALAIMDIFF